ncbi:flgB [Wigglesworthia glossinidia endosymbiont of Glossina brevipalpis]|uniref:Flagellar basal body rod protein FlgB n=1 Tax=Wigglesworthia glossinidia brevipalpis TaxID=36870 RepID=Q8D3G3_WIGBR|nr:flgB [Wigglesworthia glossinidia endosymbiont of Glossina brevipalpis]
MLDKLDHYFNFQKAATNIFANRQAIISSNIANADTPKYQSRDIDFKKLLKNFNELDKNKRNLNLKLTSKKHINKKNLFTSLGKLLYRVPIQASADGNTVDMDVERINFLDNSIKYHTSVSIIHGQIKNMMSVLYKG